MQISVENVSALGRLVTVGVPSSQLQDEIKVRTVKMTKTAKFPGFRPGKAPNEFIQQRYGNQIRQEAVYKVIDDTLPIVLKEQALKPVGTPVVEKITEEKDSDIGLQYIVSFEVLPEIILPDFSAMQIDEHIVYISDIDIDKGLKNLQIQLGKLINVERPAKQGDRVTIDYQTILNGRPHDEGNSQNVVVDIGIKQFIPGFEEGIIGMQVGEERVLNLVFPNEWRAQKVAGKPVQFTITLKTVAEREVADIDENLAKKINANGSDITAIKNKIRESLEKEAANLSLEKSKKQIIENLNKIIHFEIPKSLIKREIQLLHEDLHRRTGDKATTQCAHQGLEEEAEKRVALSLIFQKVVEQEKIALDIERVRSRVREIAKSFNNAEFIENMYYESEEMIASIKNAVLVEQALEKLLTKVICKPKPISLDDLFAYEG